MLLSVVPSIQHMADIVSIYDLCICGVAGCLSGALHGRMYLGFRFFYLNSNKPSLFVFVVNKHQAHHILD
jgi:hypothetical protein